ncbi:hypothetical protein, partial [Microcoleus sp. herbarium13]|uniref:hypothetical protein n=1 Tax=Microcoleus sp. herbarium13 TaxID=3055438 RepID=UPI002FD2FC93
RGEDTALPCPYPWDFAGNLPCPARGAQKPGFCEKTALRSAETQKNPVSQLTRGAIGNRVFALLLRYSVQKPEKTRFLWYVCVTRDRRKISNFCYYKL